MGDKLVLDNAKKAAAYKAVDEYVKDGMNVGIGSGSTIKYAVDRIKELGLKVTCVPTSFQSTQLIIEAGLVLSDLSRTPKLHVTIDGADECDKDFNIIKGGGACQLQEKCVAYVSDTLLIVADYTKDSVQLGDTWKKGIPIEVIPMAYVPVMKKLESLSLKPVLRMAVNKAGPVVSDNGNFIIDAIFTPPLQNIPQLAIDIKMIPGVVETGLFINMAKKLYFGQKDGSVISKTL
ncbi:ribose-5-phosphate isomerase [Dictyostelium purpureum]|uniref:ribose-5-phosphate isomerase n=1 Tax=Dictyostelium purpureum TaxID=5786 RepID=F1A1M7_DICPU|nr:ribose-5-phosphate isomerase [Dictyostelium purpureum]EGC29910.1 ribose-5-phosphate isomerase [Dictyostelium purpureum]|eukprot:XP_003293571.1 ribose-5-phosphate isomerase [Dictyostelium purpureum]